MNDKCTVAIVGFGYIGSVIGAVLADRGFRVLGVDRDPRIIEAVRNGASPFNEPGLDEMIGRAVRAGMIEVTDDVARACGRDVFIITVGTPLSDAHEPDLRQIRTAVEMVRPQLRDGNLVILKSTVPPGTTKDVVGAALKGAAKIHLAFCPERIAEGRAIQELTSIPVVVGGVDAASTTRAAAFWKEALGVEVIQVADAQSAEMVKLADNLWIDLNIALAGELAKISDRLGIDVLDVIHAANSLPKGMHHVNILTPSVGVGGYCLTKDPWFVQKLGKNLGFDLLLPRSSRAVNDSMPAYSAALIEGFLAGRGAGAAVKVAVLGIAFKNNTGDCRFTPTKPVIDILRSAGHQLTICDPWVGPHDVALVTDLEVSTDIEAAVTGADCVAFLAGHREFHELPIAKLAALVKPGALVFDGRMFFSREKIAEMRALGLSYKGVGR